MRPTPDKINQRFTWETPPGRIRELYRVDNFVYKRDNERLDLNWQVKMFNILERWYLPAWEGFLTNGYCTHFINGTDLHGDLPFAYELDGSHMVLQGAQRFLVLDIFANAMRVGEELGYTLGDLTCRNMMIKDGKIYLLDYEVIVDYPLNQTYLDLWTNTIRHIFKE